MEVGEVSIDIERESVKGHPSPARNTNRSDLSILNPYPCFSSDSLRSDGKFAEGLNHSVLEMTKKGMKISFTLEEQ